MQTIKKLLGLVWMILGPLILIALLYGAILNINETGTKDINKPLPWIIIIMIFAPISVGLVIFGYYAFKDEYKDYSQVV
jgi:hypothetical protein